jgi:hypothetical protein
MSIEEVSEILGEDLLKMDGYDDCIEGVVQKYGSQPFIVYDYNKVINKLMKQGMSYHEAVEFHEFNQACVYLGENTPGFIIKDNRY